jgi:hypothetical protein
MENETIGCKARSSRSGLDGAFYRLVRCALLYNLEREEETRHFTIYFCIACFKARKKADEDIIFTEELNKENKRKYKLLNNTK